MASAAASGMAVSGWVIGQRCVGVGISCCIMTAHGGDQLHFPRPPRNVLRGQARGWSLWGWLSGLPWLPSPRLRHGAASTSGCFVQVKGAGGDAVGIWREGLPVHGSQVPQRGVKSHCNSQVQSGAVGYAAHRVCSP